jgi:hypothetical protein
MKIPALPATARCRCGDTELRITAQPIMTMACHCRGCQRMSASAFSLSAAIPTAGFEVVRGQPVLGGLRNPELRHHFCPNCLSWMYTRFMPDFVNVRATMFDDPSWFRPFVETWTRTRLPWAATGAVHAFEEFPPMDGFPALLAEFARACGTSGTRA